ncbi:VRR-NUC domain-containing protein [Delftia tsuruhatensis]|uniref:VRR-NUC domain-containing protein n=1 Tax=Delftia tsuruhatensis TaxID=180282 RepID=UPI0006199F47|nr:VRR-NUC domain-containing protein [Delftia tsuruhatensis]MDH2232563.1 VRR-NUC domain-containing protein [Delftia tsuruhatensis]
MPRESAIERADRKNHKAAGRLLLKFVSPGRNGMPDDILLNPIPPEHQEIVARYFRFVEYKKPKGTPRPDQLRRHTELRALGFTVDVIDSQST